jgi:hypothetical protein
MSNKFIVLGAGMFFLVLMMFACAGENIGFETKDIDPLSNSMVDDLRSKCSMTDDQILSQGVKPADLIKVRDFCKLTKTEMIKIIGDRLKKANDKNLKPVFLGYTNSYLCYYLGLNTVPSYSNLGLTSSTCSWHDSSPSSCKVESKVACLWGCTNNDPKLGWHTSKFNNKMQFENYIYSKGYHKVSGYACYYMADDYERALSYGYRYEVTWTNSTRTAHVEGPEPDPEANWYGSINGFWPEEVFVWHKTC